MAAKVAVTVLLLSEGTAQLPGPVQAPLQPANWNPLSALAVSVTFVSGWNVAVQVEPLEPQSIPDGSLVTMPLPPPAGVTATVKG